jgi:hypothetical protein
MIMFALGWIGGGDAKLTAACCLWFGGPARRARALRRGHGVRAPIFFLVSEWLSDFHTSYCIHYYSLAGC